jgi:hypothetical protein
MQMNSPLTTGQISHYSLPIMRTSTMTKATFESLFTEIATRKAALDKLSEDLENLRTMRHPLCVRCRELHGPVPKVPLLRNMWLEEWDEVITELGFQYRGYELLLQRLEDLDGKSGVDRTSKPKPVRWTLDGEDVF